MSSLLVEIIDLPLKIPCFKIWMLIEILMVNKLTAMNHIVVQQSFF